ncbi:MAG: hypothetical protein JW841_16195 [Deltaproteobacteria bacterium]|nr:hypothetical protein [Deltaproteobacteria bacterium]
MKWHFHALAEHRMRRLFTANLSAKLYRRVLADTANCIKCGYKYQRYLQLEASICQNQTSANNFRLERVATLVLTNKNTEKHPLFTIKHFNVAKIWPKTILTGFALAAAAILFLVLSPYLFSERIHLADNVKLSPIEFVARGFGAQSNLANIGIRVFRVDAESNKISEDHSLSVTDTITFTYTNTSKKPRYLSLFGMQKSGKIFWYYPEASGKKSIALANDVVDEPLADGFRLNIRHKPGWLRITGVFSNEPLDLTDIEDSVKIIAQNPEQCRKLAPLTLDSLHNDEYSVLINLAPRR